MVKITGSFGDDSIVGTNGSDVIAGNFGSDAIEGGKGRDFLYGGQHTVFVEAGAGSSSFPQDTYASDNTIDRFVFNAGDSGVGGANRDVIRGFEAGIDKIDLSSMGSDVRFTIESMGGKDLIKIDADHDGKYEMQIAVAYTNNTPTFDHITAADFILA